MVSMESPLSATNSPAALLDRPTSSEPVKWRHERLAYVRSPLLTVGHNFFNGLTLSFLSIR
eukprot:m.84635 g.84635  ORF g.84635 m.84635 type:complete len:61 (+) comp36413_c0_seq15:183-365(+)